MTVRLSLTQRAILDAAAARRDGTLTPLPSTVTMRGKNLERTLAALVRRGFATDTSTQRDDAVARPLEEASAISLVITPAGRAAIGAADVVEAEVPSPDLPTPDTPLTLVPAPVPGPGGKLGMVLQFVSAGRPVASIRVEQSRAKVGHVAPKIESAGRPGSAPSGRVRDPDPLD